MNDARKLVMEPRGDREIVITRAFNARRALVWEAWTKPELLKRWLYGPDGWRLDVCDMDLRPGGQLRWVWRNNDGTEMGLRGTYKEVIPPDRIVHTELFDEDWTGGETLVTLTFEEQSGITTVVMTVLYQSREAREGALISGMDHGMGLGYDRMDGILEELSATAAGAGR